MSDYVFTDSQFNYEIQRRLDDLEIFIKRNCTRCEEVDISMVKMRETGMWAKATWRKSKEKEMQSQMEGLENRVSELKQRDKQLNKETESITEITERVRSSNREVVGLIRYECMKTCGQLE